MRGIVLSVVYLVLAVNMALFDLQLFINHPSIEQDLLKIVNHYKIQALSSRFERLVELRILVKPGVDAGEIGPLGAAMRPLSAGALMKDRVTQVPRLRWSPRPRPSCCLLICSPLSLLGLKRKDG